MSSTMSVGKATKVWIETRRMEVWRENRTAATFTSVEIASELAPEFSDLDPAMLISRVASTLVGLHKSKKIVKAKKDIKQVVSANNRNIITWRTNRRIDLEPAAKKVLAKVETPVLNNVFAGNEPVDHIDVEFVDPSPNEITEKLKETIVNLPMVTNKATQETYLEILGSIIDLTTKLTDPNILLATFSDKELAEEQLRRASQRELQK